MKINALKSCRGCGAEVKPEQWTLAMAPIPMVGKLYADQQTAISQPAIPLTWTSCHNCGLLQVVEDVADSEIYDEYNYASSSFKGLQSHFDDFSDVIDNELSQRTDSLFVEVGCNDGILIKRVSNANRKIGVDPSDIAKKNQDNSYTLINEYFSQNMKNSFLNDSVDIISTSNSFAHFTDISGAIKEIRRILKPDGLVFVEVHDGDLLIDDFQWDTIYHEHKVEWTVDAARQCFEEKGLYLTDVTKLPMHGGTIRLKFSKSKLDIITKNSINSWVKPDLTTFEARFNSRFDNAIWPRLEKLDTFCCYGASGRAVNWIYQLGLQDKVKYIYDDSFERIGKFIGHCGIEIRSGDNVNETGLPIVITAWNFSENIRQRHADKDTEWLQYYS